MSKIKTKNKKIRIRDLSLVIGSFLIIVGILVNIFMVVYNTRTTNSDESDLQDFFDSFYSYPVEEIDEEQENSRASNSNYVAVIEIPRINLRNGIFDKDSSANNVDRNIYTLPGSDMPDEIWGNLKLAAHSGNSRISFFRHLNKLDINDEIYIYYEGAKYVYRVFDVYDVPKLGGIQFREYDFVAPFLTLITCRQRTNNQIVVVSELIAIESLN